MINYIKFLWHRISFGARCVYDSKFFIATMQIVTTYRYMQEAGMEKALDDIYLTGGKNIQYTVLELDKEKLN